MKIIIEPTKIPKNYTEDLSFNKTEIFLKGKSLIFNVLKKDNKEFLYAIDKLEEIGFEFKKITNVVPVLNMTCAACVRSVENILKSTVGVLNANVNLAQNNVEITFIPEVTSLEKFQTALHEFSYDLVIEKGITIEDINDKIYKRYRNNTIAAFLISLPVFLLSMFFEQTTSLKVILWILTTPVIFWIGRNFYISAYKKAKHFSSNMDTLVALGTFVAYLFSVFNTLFPQIMLDNGLSSDVYFEASAVIITFILLGKTLEHRAKLKTTDAIKKLIGLQAKEVTKIVAANVPVNVKIEDVQKGDLLLARPGEKIAVDGIIEEGKTLIDESSLTGEPLPVSKTIADKIYAGTLNQSNMIYYRATKVGSETLLSQIIKSVEKAQSSKAEIQTLADKVASIFVPTVILLSLLTFVLWIIIGGVEHFTFAILSMVSVLVIACPCALGLATPTALIVGIGKASNKGILIKDATALETVNKIDTVVLDKTGTLTLGKPTVNEIFFPNKNKHQLSILYSLEKYSDHPLANSISDKLKENSFLKLNFIENIPGYGIKGQIGHENYYVGNIELLNMNGINITSVFKDKINQYSKETYTIVYFANSFEILAIIALSDEIRESAPRTIDKLHKMEIEVIMLTGDNAKSATKVAQMLKIDSFKAELLPNDKLLEIKRLQKDGKKVAMVGDGINDAAALAQADLSIAMGQGSDISIDVAQMTIIKSDISKIFDSFSISKQTLKTIKQNLFWAFLYNIIMIPLAAGVLFPINGFTLNPMFAGMAMAFSSVSVVTNSLILKLKK